MPYHFRISLAPRAPELCPQSLSSFWGSYVVGVLTHVVGSVGTLTITRSGSVLKTDTYDYGISSDKTSLGHSSGARF